MAMTPELESKIAIWRARAINGTLTQEDMKEAILALRADRIGAAVASAASKRVKAKAEVPDADALLKEMGL